MIHFQGKCNQDLEDILIQLLEGWRGILGDKFLGAYLGGSFAHGGWDEYSDVDFNVVVESDLNQNELVILKVLHTRIYNIDTNWSKHLEGSFFPKEVLSDLSKVDQPLWYLDNGSLDFQRSCHDNTLVNRWVLREYGVILDGPNPKVWIPPVPEELLKDEVRSTMRSWGSQILGEIYKLDNRWVQTFAVLSFCRMAQTVMTGEIQSKYIGAVWVKDHLGSHWHTLVDDALSARENQYEKVFQPSDPERVNQTKAFIQHIMKIFC